MTQTYDARRPDRLWMGAPCDDGEHEIWFDPDEGGTEYIRADLATQPDPLADPRVVALEKALRDAGGYIDKGRPQMAQNIIRDAIAALDAGGKSDE